MYTYIYDSKYQYISHLDMSLKAIGAGFQNSADRTYNRDRRRFGAWLVVHKRLLESPMRPH